MSHCILRPSSYRKHRLQEMGFTDSDVGAGGKSSISFAEQYNTRRASHLSSLQQKEEDMRQKFVIRVKEKEGELKEAEKEVHAVWFIRNRLKGPFWYFKNCQIIHPTHGHVVYSLYVSIRVQI